MFQAQMPMGMRTSGGSHGSSISGSQGMRNSWDKRSSGSSAMSGGRDSRGSYGSTDGIRLSSGPEMAGVGIFFQQEPSSGRVYVANIVEGGSADRSGVIRVNDVIVKVDDEDVQGQPLSILRTLILGKQGTYVVLAFRRMTGTELYYFDVELVRGTPEYFESLKKNQAIQDEKDKLLNQVRQQEKDIMALRSMATSSAPVPVNVDSIRRELDAVNERIKRVDASLEMERKQKLLAASGRSGAEQQLMALRSENSTLNKQLEGVHDLLEGNKTKYQTALSEWQSTKERLQGELNAAVSSSSSSSSTAENRAIEEENMRLRAWLRESEGRDAPHKAKLSAALHALEEVRKQNDANIELIGDIIPALDGAHTQLFSIFGYTPSPTKS